MNALIGHPMFGNVLDLMPNRNKAVVYIIVLIDYAKSAFSVGVWLATVGIDPINQFHVLIWCYDATRMASTNQTNY